MIHKHNTLNGTHHTWSKIYTTILGAELENILRGRERERKGVLNLKNYWWEKKKRKEKSDLGSSLKQKKTRPPFRSPNASPDKGRTLPCLVPTSMGEGEKAKQI